MVPVVESMCSFTSYSFLCQVERCDALSSIYIVIVLRKVESFDYVVPEREGILMVRYIILGAPG